MPTSFFQSSLGPSFPQLAGEIFSVEIPSRLAPRHCGQSTAFAKEQRKQDADTASKASESVLFMIASGRSPFVRCQTRRPAANAQEVHPNFRARMLCANHDTYSLANPDGQVASGTHSRLRSIPAKVRIAGCQTIPLLEKIDSQHPLNPNPSALCNSSIQL